jgi:predicted NBD/HSP70 family sugar kinase
LKSTAKLVKLRAGPVVADWTTCAIDQLRCLCLVIMRTFAPEAIAIGGRVADPIMDRFITELSEIDTLGEHLAMRPPAVLRALSDPKPQLGAAALPVYFRTNSALND